MEFYQKWTQLSVLDYILCCSVSRGWVALLRWSRKLKYTWDFAWKGKGNSKKERRRREDFLYCFYISGGAQYRLASVRLPHYRRTTAAAEHCRAATSLALIMSCHRSSGSLRNWNIDYAELWSYLVVWERWLRGENVPLLCFQSPRLATACYSKPRVYTLGLLTFSPKKTAIKI